ncbi:MAG: GNAT family N-acetyltransferase [Acidobacteriota bacterium]|nr:GNAT family N-acetyltransferase [Acidobacteriota bacterium]
MKTLETSRLVIRMVELDDAAFMLDLLNQPSFVQFIGDRGVRTLEEARTYIEDRALAGYEKDGFGPFAVDLKSSDEVIGIVSLLNRDELDDVDVGFAFLPDFWRQGFASEASASVMDFAFSELGLERLIAVTQSDNTGSIRTLEKLGFARDGLVRLEEDGPDLLLYAIEH